MKKILGIITIAFLCMGLLCACEAGGTSVSKEGRSSKETSVTKEKTESKEKTGAKEKTDSKESPATETGEDEEQQGSTKTDDDLNWDGEWTGGGVTVEIYGSKTGTPDVSIVDEEMHTSLDEAYIDGNTLTGVYRITLEMYPEDNGNLPEQEWTITMVKDGGLASYSRTAVLTWFNLNEDGTYGHTVTKENSASLTKVIKNKN